MWQHSLLVTMLAVSLAACTPLETLRTAEERRPVYPPATFSHRVGTVQVVLYWNCVRPDPGVLRLDGVAHNPHFSEIRFLEFDLVGVDADGREVSQARGASSDYILRTNQFSPFRLDVRTVGREVRFDLFYRYRSQQNLRPSLAVPTVASPRLLAQAEIQLMARDVCSETQHRIPKPAR